MAMGRQGPRQDEMLVTWGELPKSPGHVFYDRLQTVLAALHPAARAPYGAHFLNGLLADNERTRFAGGVARGTACSAGGGGDRLNGLG